MAKNKHQTTSSYHPLYKQPLLYILIIIALGVGAYFIIKRPEEPTHNDSVTTNTINTEASSSTSSTTTIPSTPTETNSTTTDTSVSPDGKTPEKYEGADPNISESLTGYITTARFSVDKLIIRINIDQYLSNGTCTLTLYDGSNQLEKTAKLSPAASTSTCEGFDIQSSELSSFSRPINITIDLSSGDKHGSITGRAE